MANNWFNATGYPTTRGRGWSDEVRAQFATIAQAFDRLPNPRSGAGQGFVGGTYESPFLLNATMFGGTLGNSANPTVLVSSYALLGYGNGFAPGTAPSDAGAMGAFYRVANTTRLAYGRANAGGVAPTFFMDDKRAFVVGDGSNEMATTSTEGFIYIPTINGTPTGAPTLYTGSTPMVFDRSTNRIWVRSGMVWRSTAALT